MTSVKLTDMMSASSGDVIAALGTTAGTESASSDRKSFATVMNDTAQGHKAPEKNTYSGQTGRNEDVQERYQAGAKSDAMGRKVSKTDAAETDKIQNLQENQEELTEDFAQGMKQLLTEKLEISEENLEAAMTALGLSYMDLLNPSNLTLLAAQLTDTEDACTLLMNESFTQILQQSEQLMSGLSETTGLSREELLTWMENQNKEELEEPEMISTVAQTENPETVLAGMPERVEKTEGLLEETAYFEGGKGTPLSKNHTEQWEPEKDGEIRPEQILSEENVKSGTSVRKDETFMKPEDTATMTEETLSQEARDSLSGQLANKMFDADGSEEKDGHSNQFFHGQNTAFENARAEAVTEPVTVPQTNSTHVDAVELIRQFGEFVRLHVAQDTTSLDMQLNPENLGKLYLHISTGKDGNVTAEIAATSQEVKEALETQIAELRVNLNQQGVKVDAVEVTVASHEFEQNLEQNAFSDRQQGEEQEQQNQGRVRSLLRGELDDLSGIMSEEEMLAAKIMKDNGNSMDVTV